MSGWLTLSGSDMGEPSGSRALGPWEINAPPDSSVDEILDAQLVLGDNVIPIPIGAVAAVLLPQAGSPALRLRTNVNVADAGLPLAVVAAQDQPVPFLYAIGAGVNELIINSVGAGTCDIVFI